MKSDLKIKRMIGVLAIPLLGLLSFMNVLNLSYDIEESDYGLASVIKSANAQSEYGDCVTWISTDLSKKSTHVKSCYNEDGGLCGDENKCTATQQQTYTACTVYHCS